LRSPASSKARVWHRLRPRRQNGLGYGHGRAHDRTPSDTVILLDR
jgi:hypothetical protein